MAIFKKIRYFLTVVLLLTSSASYAHNMVLCPKTVLCKTTLSKSCTPMKTNSQSIIKWSVDPGPTTSLLVPGNYYLISANTDKITTPGSCMYMNFERGARSTFVVLVSNKMLRPLKTAKTQWSFVHKSWVCPSENTYQKIKPGLCAFYYNRV